MYLSRSTYFSALESLLSRLLRNRTAVFFFPRGPARGAVCSFVRELVSENRKPAFRGGSRGFVLDDVPMLSEDTVLQAHHVHHDPTRRSCAETRKTTMQHQEISVRQNQLILVPHCRRSVSHELEQPLPSWPDVVAVLDIPWRPEALGAGIVALVEQSVEGLEHNGLVLLFD